MSADSQLWYVKIADGAVHPATLEQIDDAFNAGHIDENTLVLAAGERQWKRLGELAGLDAAPSATPSSVSVPRSSTMPSPLPSSLRPLSLDLEGDPDVAALRPKSRGRRAFSVVVGALVIGGIAFAAARTAHQASPPVAAAALPPPAPEVAASDPVGSAPAPSPSDQAASRFSDAQKEKLLAADKARDEQTKSRRKFNPGSTHHGSRSYKSQGFTSGGNKYDPLNSSL